MEPEADESEYRESFGDFLRRHREASGKTLDGIARTTRISKRYLQAFEDNDVFNLPEEAFARGFLKSYALELGLDPEDCLVRYERFRRSLMPTQVREFKKPEKQVVLGGGEGSPRVQTLSQSLRPIFILGGAALLIFGGYMSMKTKKTEPQVVVEELPVVELSAPQATAESVRLPEEAAPQAGMSVPVKPSLLTIVAVKDGSISLRLDDQALQEFTLKTGEKQTFTVAKEVEIRMNDKSAFSFLYNLKPLEVSGPVIKLFNRNLLSSTAKRP